LSWREMIESPVEFPFAVQEKDGTTIKKSPSAGLEENVSVFTLPEPLVPNTDTALSKLMTALALEGKSKAIKKTTPKIFHHWRARTTKRFRFVPGTDGLWDF